MSYEGFDQYLCEDGHNWEQDVYDFSRDSHICPVCGKEAVWENPVDETNGPGKRVKLKKSGENTFSIPKTRGIIYRDK